MKIEKKKGLLERLLERLPGHRQLVARRRRRHRRMLRLLAIQHAADRRQQPFRRMPDRAVQHRIGARRRSESRYFQVVGPPMRSW